MYRTEKAIRTAFWQQHPKLSRKKIRAYSGIGTMYCTDTRVAFVDWIDALSKNGEISQALAERVTLAE